MSQSLDHIFQASELNGEAGNQNSDDLVPPVDFHPATENVTTLLCQYQNGMSQKKKHTSQSPASNLSLCPLKTTTLGSFIRQEYHVLSGNFKNVVTPRKADQTMGMTKDGIGSM